MVQGVGTVAAMNNDEAQHGLETEENRLRTMRDALRADSEDSDGIVEQHSSDAGSEQAQREVDLSILEQVEAELEDVERALRKLEQGSYGLCEVCNEQIVDERLEAQPATRYCTVHAEAASQPG